MGWLERLTKVVLTQFNSLIQEDEDPEIVLEQIIQDVEQQLIRLRQGVAEAIANYKRTEREYYRGQQSANVWHEKAKGALREGQEVKAREHLHQWQNYKNQIAPLQAQLAQQVQIIDNLKKDLRAMEAKYSEIKSQRTLLLARLRSAAAAQKIQNHYPNDLFERMDCKIRELQAERELSNHLSEDPFLERFASLEKDKN